MADQQILFTIRADTAQGKAAIEGFTKSLAQTGTQSQKTLSSFRQMEQQANQSWAANRRQILLVSAAIAGATVGLLAIAKQTAEYGEQMQVAAQKTGMGVEQLQAFRYAAEQSEVSFEAVMIGVKMLSKAFSGLAEVKGAAEALAALNIQAKASDGAMRPMHDLLLEIGERFQQMRDGPEKAALAVALFGRSGTELIPVLNMGRAGILALEKQAHDLGIVLDTETIRAAAQLSDEFTLVEKTLKGVQFSIAQELIPTLNDWLLMLVALAQVGLPSTGQALRDLAAGMFVIAAAVNPLTATLFAFSQAFREQIFAISVAISGNKKQTEDMTARILEMRRVLSLPGAKGGAPPAFDLEAESAKKAADEIKKLLATMVEQAVGVGKTQTQIQLYRLETMGASAAQLEFAQAVADTIDQLEAQETSVKAVEGLLKGLTEQVATFGQSEEAVAIYNLRMAGATEAQIEFARAVLTTKEALNTQKVLVAANATALKEQADKVSEAAKEQAAAFDAAGRSVKESLQTPAEKASIQFRELVQLLGSGRISADEFSKATINIQAGLSASARLGRQMGQEIGDAFTQMIVYGRGGIQMLKGLLEMIVAAIIKATLFKSIFESLGGVKGKAAGGVGGFFAGLFGELAGLQSGGPAEQGKPYLVGEKGPELFVPRTSGAVLPSSKVFAPSTVNNYIDARGADAAVEYRVLRALRALEGRTVAAARQQMQQAALRS